jgi:hypothetical protein
MNLKGGRSGYMLSGKIWECRFSDGCIAEAYNVVSSGIVHTDAPTEAELAMVRDQLVGVEHEMISLNWLRNRIVQLRKGNKLNKARK